MPAPPWGRRPQSEWQSTLPVVGLVIVIAAYLLVPTWIVLTALIVVPLIVFGISAALASTQAHNS